MVTTLQNLALDRWVEAPGGFVDIPSAVDGKAVARASSAGLDFGAMVRHAREVGGPALRKLTFHQRADLLRKLAVWLGERKELLYKLAGDTGANKRDNAIDIEGGLGTLAAYASRGRRDLPDGKFVVEGEVEGLSKGGSFVGQHILSPLHGVAVHINAFIFACWGLLEKFAPAFLAGVPVIAKPATATAYVTEALVRLMHESGLLPAGSLQLICGATGDLLDHLGGQDVISFTGSLETSEKLHAHPNIARHAIRFIAERDSLNAAILGPDVTPEQPEFALFVREVVREMTAKTGQKCTAIRRIFVPRAQEAAVVAALKASLAEVKLGDPRSDDKAMGPLVHQHGRLIYCVDHVYGADRHRTWSARTASRCRTRPGAVCGDRVLCRRGDFPAFCRQTMAVIRQHRREFLRHLPVPLCFHPVGAIPSAQHRIACDRQRRRGGVIEEYSG